MILRGGLDVALRDVLGVHGEQGDAHRRPDVLHLNVVRPLDVENHVPPRREGQIR